MSEIIKIEPCTRKMGEGQKRKNKERINAK